jgi:signal transduction histidine kinase
MQLRTKLLISFLILAFFSGVIGFVGIKSSQQISNEFNDITKNSLPRLQALLEMNNASTEIKVLTANFAVSATDSTTAEGTFAADKKSEFLASINQLQKWREQYSKSVRTNEAKETKILAAVTKAEEEVVESGLDLVALKEKNASGAAVLEKQKKLNESSAFLSQLLDEAVANEFNSVKQHNNFVNDTVAQILQSNILTTAVAFILSLLIGFYISNSIAQRIILLKNAAKEISGGNLDRQVALSGSDEISQLAKAFNEMTTKLKEANSAREESTTAVQKQVNELQETKRATINLLEDVESEKAKMDEQKKILESVIHNMPIGVALSLPDGKPVLINDAGTAMLGRGVAPNAKNENITEIYQVIRSDGSTYPPTEITNYIAATQGIAVTKDDMIVKRPDGKKFSVRSTSVPVKNAQGQVLSVITVFEDVTKEREVDRMKTEFISLASHQLRTPLSAIRWFTEMLLSGDAGELNTEQKDFTKNIGASTQRMIELVNSLLNISRIESGRIVIDPKPTDLKELVEGVVTDLKAKIEEKKHTLLISVHEGLDKINLDPRLIRQVYMNLLTNAIKYTPKGGEITVFISKKDDKIISQVTDNGYGIPKEQQGKMFQKFFRAENIIKVETDGTGLGMYLIKAIIESSQGKIWFESEEGKGTTFWFSLPITGMVAKKGEVTLD